jgi:Domain of unknown function (DUF4410)
VFTRFKRMPVAAAIAIIIATTTGCATTVPKAKFSHELNSTSHVGISDAARVSVDAPDSVKILNSEKSRLAEKIQKKIDDRKIANAGYGTGKTYEVDLHLSKYDKGNAFARAMLAGLGQIHINGKVDVYEMPEHVLVGEFDLNKTFAWGGIYGVATSMEDIEDTFADGVAATVTGQEEAPPKQKS